MGLTQRRVIRKQRGVVVIETVIVLPAIAANAFYGARFWPCFLSEDSRHQCRSFRGYIWCAEPRSRRRSK